MEFNPEKRDQLLRIIIVDDEPEVQDLFSIYLRDRSDLNVVGIACNVEEALQLTLDHHPDLVLLDIQMPERDGFSYIEELHEMGLYPGIIFITAYENYAIQAIKNAAFDYLLKPVRKEELMQSIDRFYDFLNRNRKDDLSQLIDLLKGARPGRIRLNTRTGYFFVDPEEIFYVEADGNYSHIHLVTNKKEITTMSLGNVEKLLVKYSYLRVSRSFIVNMKFISKVDRRNNLCQLEYNGMSHQVKVPAKNIKLLEEYF